MKSSAMFGSLKNIWTKNTGSRIRRYSLTRSMKKGTYIVTAVCLGKVEYQDDDVFRYYDF